MYPYTTYIHCSYVNLCKAIWRIGNLHTHIHIYKHIYGTYIYVCVCVCVYIHYVYISYQYIYICRHLHINTHVLSFLHTIYIALSPWV